MKNKTESLYGDVSEAVAFVINFEFMIYSYEDLAPMDIEKLVCFKCNKYEQFRDFYTPKRNCKKEFGRTDLLKPAVSKIIRNELIENFDITKKDFRPIRNKDEEIVFYQITPIHKMLPIESVNRIRKLKPCKKCGSIQYRIKEYENEQGEPYYYITKEVLEKLHDINITFEEFTCYAPLYVVSRRVYDFLIKKYPRMWFKPMFLK
jgi:hypothetical protein